MSQHNELSRRIDTFPNHPALDVIQGGMGVNVSSPELAGAVAREGATGLISATAAGTLVARMLQDGHEDMKRIFEQFPVAEVVDPLLEKYYIAGGRDADSPYRNSPVFGLNATHEAIDLETMGTYALVMRAKELSGGNGLIGVNKLTKIQESTIGLMGAVLAGADLVVMGAGLPTNVKAMMEASARGEAYDYPISVTRASKEYVMRADIRRYLAGNDQELRVPRMLGILTSEILVRMLPDVDGYIFELPEAGGHNIAPRGKREPGAPLVYDPVRDYPNYDRLRKLDKPYWMAGTFGNKDGLERARAAGAVGIQAGSVFALTDESGIRPDLKNEVRDSILGGQDVEITTDGLASPTGFPFKVAEVPGTLSEDKIYEDRQRICDLSYLREPVETLHPRTGEPRVIYRCPSEPVKDYERKRVGPEDPNTYMAQIIGRKCLCNGLIATAGMPQRRADGSVEPPIMTLGDSVNRDVREIGLPLTAARVVAHLRSEA